MINFPIKVLIGAGAAGAVGLGGYGIYSLASTKTIQKVLEIEGFTILSTNLNSDDNKTEWEAKVDKLNGESSTPKLAGYEKATEGDATQKKAADIKKVKGICKDLLASSSSDASKLEQAKAWCAKKASITPAA